MRARVRAAGLGLLLVASVACKGSGEAGVQALQRWEQEICACTDLACARTKTLAMQKELAEIDKSTGKVTDTQQKELVEIGNRIAGCIARLKQEPPGAPVR